MAYLRIEGERLKSEIEKDYDDYLKQCKTDGKQARTPPAGRQNQFLSKRFKEEMPDFQAQIRASRQQCRSMAPGSVLQALLDTENPLEEEERKAYAVLMEG